ncbi:MAG TPA: DUF1549 domain-containing protein [Pirellulales bacterium]|nr:DUF1549 domain-containing protein [Pirellulales bacterium]
MPHSPDRVAILFSRPARRLVVMLLAGSCALGLVAAARAEEPLHERIDRLIEADALIPLAPAASDAEFLRRATLDLIGRIPSAAEARAFVADASADKRPALYAVNRFLREIKNGLDALATFGDLRVTTLATERSRP